MLKKIKSILLFDVSSDRNSKLINDLITEDNRKFAVIWTLAQVIYWGYSIVASFFESDYAKCRYAYVAAMILTIIAWFFATVFSKKHPKLTIFTEFFTNAALFVGGLLIAWILLRDDTKTLMLFISVIIAPVFFIKNTLSNLIMIVIEVISSAILLSQGLDPEVYKWAISNLVIFSSIGVALAHFINKARYERYVFAESADRLLKLQTEYAYYDQMTGLKNRRSFSEKSEAFEKSAPDYCCVIMADINGLKKTNDTLGHEAGDELIIAAADCLRAGFGKSDLIYRIGGDEFCIMLTDPDINADECIAFTKKNAAEHKGNYVNEISIAFGYAATTEFTDFETLLKEADMRMYENKRIHYEKVGRN